MGVHIAYVSIPKHLTEHICMCRTLRKYEGIQAKPTRECFNKNRENLSTKTKINKSQTF